MPQHLAPGSPSVRGTLVSSPPPWPRRICTVLFDMDGVLVDSRQAWFRVMNRACRHFGCRELTEEAFRAAFGLGVAYDAEHIFGGRPEAEIRDFYTATFAEEVGAIEADPAAEAVLREFRACGFRQAVVTNTPRPLARRILEEKGLMPYLDALAASGDAPEKPAPDLIFHALDGLGGCPAECVYVGDSPTDRRATEAAGVFMLGLGTPGDRQLQSLGDLPRALQERR